jgi:hypothetical protein
MHTSLHGAGPLLRRMAGHSVTDPTNAARQARYRARHVTPRQLAPCPSLAAYRRHKRHKEPVCDGCRQVYNAEQRRLYALRVKGKQ